MKPVIQIDGQTVDPDSGADIVETEAGVYSAIAGGAVFEIRMDRDSLTVGGRRLEFSVEDPRAWKHEGGAAGMHGKASVVAPMPGKVVRILVAAGDEVKQGQGLVVVEAMKMQNEMKSPKAGRIAEVKTKPDAAVAAGDVLVVVE
jgi:biotin carboxyl carrier protein